MEKVNVKFTESPSERTKRVQKSHVNQGVSAQLRDMVWLEITGRIIAWSADLLLNVCNVSSCGARFRKITLAFTVR